MGSEWREVKVSDVCSLIVDCVNKTAPIVSHQTPFRMIRTPDIKNGNIYKTDLRCVDEATYNAWTRRARVLDGDILLTREAPIGEVGLVRGDDTIFLGQRIMQYRADEKLLDNKYLLYSFLSEPLQNQFKSHGGSGSVVDHIRVPDCLNFVLTLPPLPIQRQIAAILCAFDDKIELNRRMNRTLEQMARALFKSWFVDFDPVRAKMRGEVPQGMDAETAALFPAEMDEVEGREVPKGWEWGTAGDFANITIGKTPPRKEPEWFTENPDDVIWVSIKDMSGDDVFISKSSEFLTSEAVQRFNIKKIYPGAVILSFKLTLGRVRIADDTITTNEAIAHFSFKDSKNRIIYTYLYLSCYDFTSLGSTSSIATAINSRIIREMPFLIPTEKILAAFSLHLAALMDQIKNIQRESAQLASLRDVLLPRLLSGEVEVSGWGEVISKAASLPD